MNKETLEILLEAQTVQEIAKSIGSSRSAVYRLMKKFDIVGRNPRERIANKTVGQKFGKLYVNSNTLAKHGRYIKFHCTCDCGKNKDISYENLLISKIDHCGCETKSKIRKTKQKEENICKDLLTKCKIAATRRKIYFNLTINDVWETFLKQNSKCAITGINLEIVSTATHSSKDRNASIDRKDSTKGYIKDNIQIVHKRINVIKGNMSLEELVYWSSLVCNNIELNTNYNGTFAELGPHNGKDRLERTKPTN